MDLSDKRNSLYIGLIHWPVWEMIKDYSIGKYLLQPTWEHGTCPLDLPTLLILSACGILLKIAGVPLAITWAWYNIPLPAILEEEWLSLWILCPVLGLLGECCHPVIVLNQTILIPTFQIWKILSNPFAWCSDRHLMLFLYWLNVRDEGEKKFKINQSHFMLRRLG